MAGVLHECTRAEEHAVVHFLWAKELSTAEVHRVMHPVYGDNCFSRKTVFSWIQEFNMIRQSIRDQERPGRPAEVSTEVTVQRVQQINSNDRHMSIDYIAHSVCCSLATAYDIMNEQLKFVHSGCSAGWLRNKNVQNGSVLAASQSVHWGRRGLHGMKNWKDLSWNGNIPPHQKKKKFKTIPSACKVMLTMFWDMQGVILQKFQPHGENVNAASYCTTLWELRQAIRHKQPGLLTKGVILQELLWTFRWDCLDHPLYSPDLAPSDFHLFGPLKNYLGVCHFANDDAVIQEVTRWLRKQPKDFFFAGFQGLLKRWDKCLNVQEEYVEKWNRFQDVTLIIIASIQFCDLYIDSPSYNLQSENEV